MNNRTSRFSSLEISPFLFVPAEVPKLDAPGTEPRYIPVGAGTALVVGLAVDLRVVGFVGNYRKPVELAVDALQGQFPVDLPSELGLSANTAGIRQNIGSIQDFIEPGLHQEPGLAVGRLHLIPGKYTVDIDPVGQCVGHGRTSLVLDAVNDGVLDEIRVPVADAVFENDAVCVDVFDFTRVVVMIAPAHVLWQDMNRDGLALFEDAAKVILPDDVIDIAGVQVHVVDRVGAGFHRVHHTGLELTDMLQPAEYLVPAVRGQLPGVDARVGRDFRGQRLNHVLAEDRSLGKLDGAGVDAFQITGRHEAQDGGHGREQEELVDRTGAVGQDDRGDRTGLNQFHGFFPVSAVHVPNLVVVQGRPRGPEVGQTVFQFVQLDGNGRVQLKMSGCDIPAEASCHGEPVVVAGEHDQIGKQAGLERGDRHGFSPLFSDSVQDVCEAEALTGVVDPFDVREAELGQDPGKPFPVVIQTFLFGQFAKCVQIGLERR